MANAKCLSCGAMIKLGAKPKVGKLFNCDSCMSEFELVWLDPVELDWPFDDYEDDDEDDFDDDFDEDPKLKTFESYEDME